MAKKKLYLKIFLQAMYSGMLLVGVNSYLAIARKKFVEELGWLGDDELLDFSVMAESVPGGNACNFFTLLGYKVGGVTGSALMYLGVITAPIIIMTVIALFYDFFIDSPWLQIFMQGMTTATCAIIVGVIVDIGGTMAKTRGFKVFWITGAAFILNYFFHVSIAWLILAGVAASIILSIIKFTKA